MQSTVGKVVNHDRAARRAVLLCAALVAIPAASLAAEAGGGAGGLGPPGEGRPLELRARFALNNINTIDDSNETFQFSGVLWLRWRDQRLSFDPAAAGVPEKVYQDNNASGGLPAVWLPRLVLANLASNHQGNGTVLRVAPDGTCTMMQAIAAVAKAEFDLRKFPFDTQRLTAAFEVFGFDTSEVVMRLEPGAGVVPTRDVRLPQWDVGSARLTVAERPATLADPGRLASVMTLEVEVGRRSWFERRLIVLPLVVVVLLSSSVFWMDRSSLGDRLNISFIGILSAVTYQIFASAQLPRIAYPTLLHMFLGVSFLAMCAGAVMNLVVGGMEQRGLIKLGERIDRICRLLFPLGYVSILLALLGVKNLLA